MALRRRIRCASERGSVAQTLALAMLVFVIAAGAGLLGAMGRLDRAPSTVPSPAPVFDEVEAVDLLEVRCVDNGAGIEVPAVSAKADGVHVQIEGVAGQKVFFQSDAGLVYPMQLREDGGTFELPLPPGSWHAACGPKGSAPPAPAAGAGFVVGDPASRYVSYQPECPLDETGQQLNGELPSSFVQNQETAIREVLADDGLLDSDLIERAGYVKSIPGEDPPNPMAFRLTRGDTVVGAFEAMEGRDGWTYFMGGCLNSEA
jgi:hypothetical protein